MCLPCHRVGPSHLDAFVVWGAGEGKHPHATWRHAQNHGHESPASEVVTVAYAAQSGVRGREHKRK